MYKYFLLLLLPFTRTDCTPPKKPLCSEDSRTLSNFASGSWECFSERTLSFQAPQKGVYENEDQMLKFYGTGYRWGCRLSAKRPYCLEGKKIFVRWKAQGDGQFADCRISLFYDKNGYGGDDNKRTDLTSLTFNNSWNGSSVIEQNKWYYTTITFGSNTYFSQTAEMDYSDKGGVLVQEKKGSLSRSFGFPAIRMGDNYGGTNASVTLAEFFIQ